MGLHQVGHDWATEHKGFRTAWHQQRFCQSIFPPWGRVVSEKTSKPHYHRWYHSLCYWGLPQSSPTLSPATELPRLCCCVFPEAGTVPGVGPDSWGPVSPVPGFFWLGCHKPCGLCERSCCTAAHPQVPSQFFSWYNWGWASLAAQLVKIPPAKRETWSIPGLLRCPGEGNGKVSTILAWEIPWTEEPGRL